jgi:hypothetical protein
MTLVKTGSGISDIRGSVSGSYFSRDKSGLHMSRHPRSIRRRSALQDKRRKAFIAARQFCRVDPNNDGTKSFLNRCVSLNIYRIYNGLSPQTPPINYQPPSL